jgi:hypothetical protein
MRIPIDGGHFFAGQGAVSAVWLLQTSDAQRCTAVLNRQRRVFA